MPSSLPTSSSRWAAGTRARSTRASATSTGSWTTRPASPSTSYGPSGTRSTAGFALFSRSSSQPLRVAPVTEDGGYGGRFSLSTIRAVGDLVVGSVTGVVGGTLRNAKNAGTGVIATVFTATAQLGSIST